MSLSENRHLLAQMLDGKSPSVVLNVILEVAPDLDKYALADIFLEEFDHLDSKILPVIWKWKSAKSIRGISDQQFDEAVLAQMKSADYMVQMIVQDKGVYLNGT
ncbi:hypothetical protein [Pseudomonas entomophila]|uniref:hypothetical protein n=1 Tax=Pseudomonas entomophila TaxID=312306 RepID=UPI001F023BF6|nr:hypothetical protein [Pseudomonas entomophila]MCG8296582.1 hypothetical protein [Pseudomonas entomophila]